MESRARVEVAVEGADSLASLRLVFRARSFGFVSERFRVSAIASKFTPAAKHIEQHGSIGMTLAKMLSQYLIDKRRNVHHGSSEHVSPPTAE
jgi:hypothetical protein